MKTQHKVIKLILIFFLASLHSIVLISQEGDLECDRLLTDQIEISTGINPATGAPVSGTDDPNWDLILYPPGPISPVGTGPGPGEIVTSTDEPFDAWFPQGQYIPNSSFNAQYLSINSSARGVKPNTIGNPFRFQRCFCLSESSELTFDMAFIADDEGKMSLIKSDNSQHYFIPSSGNSAFSAKTFINETLFLTEGRHCLIMDVRDTGSVVMGFGVEGTISGNGLLNPNQKCCPDLSTITGTKFNDQNCNGSFDKDLDTTLEGWTIQLINLQGQIVGVATTDVNGNYSFINIPNGNYTVSEVPMPGWEISHPEDNSYSIKLTGQPEAELNFFNCELPEPCSDCPSSFAPIPGHQYVLSAWVKEDSPPGSITYQGPEIYINHPYMGVSNGPFKGDGIIIDGWQRIENVITIPIDAKQIEIELNNNGNNKIYFDDIRVHPFSASMKSFVYNPVSLRLMAELDERNYATFYEYDEEGALIRVKKETALGIQTIQQSFNSTQKVKFN